MFSSDLVYLFTSHIVNVVTSDLANMITSGQAIILTSKLEKQKNLKMIRPTFSLEKLIGQDFGLVSEICQTDEMLKET